MRSDGKQLTQLPCECTFRILSFLSVTEVLRCRQISRAMNKIVADHLLNNLRELSLCEAIPSCKVLVDDARHAQQETTVAAGLEWFGHHCKNLCNLDVSCMPISDAGLTRFLQISPNLSAIDLAHCPYITDDGLKQIAESCPRLLGLDLVGCTEVGDSGVRSLLEKCTMLQVLYLGFVRGATDVGLIRLGECAHLRSLYVGGLRVSDGTLQAAAAGGNLRTLHCNSCVWVTDQALASLATLCVHLEVLNVNSCHRITDAGVCQVTRSCKRLQLLDVGECLHVSDVALLPLQGSVELTALVVDRCVGVTGETLLALCTSCPNLKRLSMSGLGHVTVEAAWAMVTQGCLSELNVLRSGDLFAELGRLLQGSEEKDVRTRLFDHEIAQLKDLRLTP
mmetsp:Transcript_27601/g.52537  ORF Transcript_27601/g.52537 Transcript_27601/m.52537 type:complete len:393 (-) Transcript_27601:607-1785(-)